MDVNSIDRAEGSAREGSSAEMYRRLVLSVTDYAIFAIDATGHVINWNPGAQRIKGYTADEVVGRHFSQFYTPEDVAAGKPQRLLDTAVRNEHVEDEGWRVRKDGSRFWASVVLTPIRDDAGNVEGFTKVTRDLTERRKAEESLRQSEEQFRLLVQSVKDYAILLLDPGGRLVSWNAGAERIKGYTYDEIVGRSFTVFYPPEARAAGYPEHELEEAAREGRYEDEGWRVRKDGTQFWANVVITALRGSGGQLLGFAKVTRDLTARREAEASKLRLAAEAAAHAEAARRSEELSQLNEELHRQRAMLEAQTVELEEQATEMQALMDQLEDSNEQLQAALSSTEAARDAALRSAEDAAAANRELDQFAYVASHDLKAPLRGISNLAQWILDDLGDGLPQESEEHMRLLQVRVRRMEALIDGVLAYSRAGRVRTEPETVDSGAVLTDVIELLAPTPGIVIEVQEGMPALQAERVSFQQVFMNLIGNAMKYGGAYRTDLVVRVRWRDAGESYEFTVVDNGPGIAPEYHDRIWGIFQTLEPRDKVEGTGIGLSVVKKVVEARGGRVWVDSSPGQGSTFGFTWPRTPDSGP
jgi:PAS domain S-box-containing protein